MCLPHTLKQHKSISMYQMLMYQTSDIYLFITLTVKIINAIILCELAYAYLLYQKNNISAYVISKNYTTQKESPI